MPFIIINLLKLSVSLAFVYLFYQWVLRRLTFYNSNRWFLIGYTLLSFFIPFINITPLLEGNQFARNEILQFIPSVERYTSTINVAEPSPVSDKWDWIVAGLFTGAVLLLVRFLFRCYSFFNMRRKAKLISDHGMKLYQVNDDIIPFSFGNAVFINSELHTEEELQEIIRHEFVHVKQRHTLDIIWSEWLCIINWYNPFAWLLKAAIRQNLEFIADHKVLENGVNKQQYQYLLLKVIGNNQFSIASKFNFSSLKKRIAMMNRLKSAKFHLVKFLFVLPLLAVILVSFRKQTGDSVTQDQPKTPVIAAPAYFTDSVPAVTEPNEKGYFIDVKGYRGNCTIVVKGKNGKEVERLLMTKWNDNVKFYEDKYGEIPPPPPPPAPPTPPAPPEPMQLPENVKKINVNNKKATVVLKDGKTEKYDLEKPEDKDAFEKKYGEILPPPPPPPPGPVKPVAAVNFETDDLASPTAPLAVSVNETIAIDQRVSVVTGDEDILLAITSKTTPDQLEAFKKQMKEKGIELKFDNVNYNDGRLVSISGTMKSKDGHSNFSASDFNKLVLAMIKNGNHTYFKVNVTDNKIVI
jgi:hypothetical protein